MSVQKPDSWLKRWFGMEQITNYTAVFIFLIAILLLILDLFAKLHPTFPVFAQE